MEFYNKVMLYFWLSLAIVSAVAVTFMCIQEGLEKWFFYYTAPVAALLMYFLRKIMIKRMHKHMKFLEEQKKNSKTN
jgi:hypothetical protein